jgi:hypothetical protein
MEKPKYIFQDKQGKDIEFEIRNPILSIRHRVAEIQSEAQEAKEELGELIEKIIDCDKKSRKALQDKIFKKSLSDDMKYYKNTLSVILVGDSSMIDFENINEEEAGKAVKDFFHPFPKT